MSTIPINNGHIVEYRNLRLLLRLHDLPRGTIDLRYPNEPSTLIYYSLVSGSHSSDQLL